MGPRVRPVSLESVGWDPPDRDCLEGIRAVLQTLTSRTTHLQGLRLAPTLATVGTAPWAYLWPQALTRLVGYDRGSHLKSSGPPPAEFR